MANFQIEIIIGVSSVIFGITALILASRARQRLTPGLIRSYIDSFSVCLSFVVIFSIWLLIRDIFTFKSGYSGPSVLFPEYIFISLAYLAFIIASYRVSHISHTFGFRDEGSKIKKLVDQKRNKKR